MQISISVNAQQEQLRGKINLLLKGVSQRAGQFNNLFFDLTNQDLYDEKFNEDPNYQQIMTFCEWQYIIENPTPSPICSRSIGDYENKKAFRCYDCMQTDSAIICYECFVKGNHKGHSYRQFNSESGCCDCGDTQSWSEQGCCPTHTPKNVEIKIDENIRLSFVTEIKLEFYHYFYLAENLYNHFPNFRQIYGNELFKYLGKIAEQNYQLKVLLSEVLNSGLQQYPPLMNSKNSILEHIFHLDPKFVELTLFRKIAFELFPVEHFRSSLIKQYFKLSSTNKFTSQHPFKKINYQFLICVKLINALISKNQLSPLKLNPQKDVKDPIILTSIMKRYYEDLNYLSKMKDRKTYHLFHFQMTNICDMAFHRKFSLIKDQKIINVDEFFLKLLGTYLKSILDNKKLLEKCLKELFHFIINFEEMTYSLAQQRAFALVLLAYLQGQLYLLQKKEVLSKILSLLGMQQNNNFQSILTKLIKRGLKNMILINSMNLKYTKNGYQNYFMGQYPQNHFVLHLDMIYHKILILFSINHVKYVQVIEQLIKQLKQQQKSIELIAQLSHFLTSLNMIDLDEVSISNFIGYSKYQKIIQFYNRLLHTFNDKFNIKQFSGLASYFINNQQKISQFLSNSTIYENSRVKARVKDEQLQKILYKQLIKTYKGYDQIKEVILKDYTILQNMKDIELYNENIILLMTNNTLELLEQVQKNQSLKKYCQYAVNALIRIYLVRKYQSLQSFFNDFHTKIKQYDFLSDSSSQINSFIKNNQQIINQNNQLLSKKDQQLKKRRQLIENKKNQFSFKKNQQDILSQYNFKQECIQIDNCIYCKQQLLQEDCYYMSYVNTTNLISKYFIKIDNRTHLFFTTCGHQVHKNCFDKYFQSKNESFACFLCKKETNLIIPKISKMTQSISFEELQKKSLSFTESIFSSILLHYSENLQQFGQFYEKEYQSNILKALIVSFTRQLIYNGLNNYQFFQKYCLPIFKELIIIIKMLPKDDLTNILSLAEQNSQETHILIRIEKQFYKYLKEQLLGIKSIPVQDETIKPLIDQLIRLFHQISTNEHQKLQLANVSLISKQTLFIKLPQKINELHSLMGQCPFCNSHTNWIYYCLVCGWKSCTKQAKQFHKHSNKQHSDGTVFICAANGNVAFVCNGKAKNKSSVYVDQYGQSYTHSQENLCKVSKLKFLLNNKEISNIYKVVMGHMLHNSS